MRALLDNYLSVLLRDGYAHEAVLMQLSRQRYPNKAIENYLRLAAAEQAKQEIAAIELNHRARWAGFMRELVEAMHTKGRASASAIVQDFHKVGFFDTEAKREAFRGAWLTYREKNPA